MTAAINEMLKLLGFSAPLLYAVAVYGVFHFLDKKASGKAKAAISGWFKPLSYDKVAVAAAMVEVFDRLYTWPLWKWPAFLRSAVISIVITSVVVYRLTPGAGMWFVVPSFIANILSDYISLFFVRRWLRIAGEHPIFALLSGPLVAAIIIVIFFYLRDVVAVSRMSDESILYLAWGLLNGNILFNALGHHSFLYAAIAVHLWLPLFALGVIFVQAINSFLWAAAKMRWFLKQGQHHPLEAIGYVAAAIVFLVTTATTILGRFLL